MSNVISFGASITYGSELPDQSYTWSSIIARKLDKPYRCLAKPALSNSGIARHIISYDDYADDLVLVMWTSGTRYEFRDENSYYQITPWSEQSGFTRAWYTGPGGYEYTEVINTVQSVLLATQFLEGMGLDYLFVFDNDELRTSHTWTLPDNYIQTLKIMMPWDNIMWFDGTGFLDWSRTNQYSFINTHPGTEAHQAAADYILANRSFNFANTNSLPVVL